MWLVKSPIQFFIFLLVLANKVIILKRFGHDFTNNIARRVGELLLNKEKVKQGHLKVCAHPPPTHTVMRKKKTLVCPPRT